MDIIEFSTPKILFIKGVFKKDCVLVDDLFNKKILNQITDIKEVTKNNNYKPLPAIFDGLNFWPKETCLKCFYCDRKFEEVPVFIPKTIEPSKDGYIMSTEGCFCTFNCASSYIDIYYHKINDNLNKKNMLKLLYKVFTGKTVTNIENSPSKYKLIYYGGDLTNLEYGKLIPKID